MQIKISLISSNFRVTRKEENLQHGLTEYRAMNSDYVLGVGKELAGNINDTIVELLLYFKLKGLSVSEQKLYEVLITNTMVLIASTFNMNIISERMESFMFETKENEMGFRFKISSIPSVKGS